MELLVICGCECWLTHKTAQAIKADLARAEAEARWEQECWGVLKEAIADWEATHSPEAWDFLSDYYKEVNGFRPSVWMFN